MSWHSVLNIWRDTKATSPIVKYFSLAHVVYIEERRKSSAVECNKHFLFECSSILIVKWDESELFIEIVCHENASGFDAWEVEQVCEESGMAVQHDKNSVNLHRSKSPKIRWNVKREISAFFILPIYYSTSILFC